MCACVLAYLHQLILAHALACIRTLAFARFFAAQHSPHRVAPTCAFRAENVHSCRHAHTLKEYPPHCD